MRPQYDAEAGRTGEAGEPGKALFGRRHIFVLVAVGARHQEAVMTAAFEFGARCGDPLGGSRSIRLVLEGLVKALTHGNAGTDERIRDQAG